MGNKCRVQGSGSIIHWYYLPPSDVTRSLHWQNRCFLTTAKSKWNNYQVGINITSTLWWLKSPRWPCYYWQIAFSWWPWLRREDTCSLWSLLFCLSFAYFYWILHSWIAPCSRWSLRFLEFASSCWSLSSCQHSIWRSWYQSFRFKFRHSRNGRCFNQRNTLVIMALTKMCKIITQNWKGGGIH